MLLRCIVLSYLVKFTKEMRCFWACAHDQLISIRLTQHLWCSRILRHRNVLLGKLPPGTDFFLCDKLPPNSHTSGCRPYSTSLKMEIVILFITLKYLTYILTGRNGPWNYGQWDRLTTAVPLKANDGGHQTEYILHSAMVLDPHLVPMFFLGTYPTPVKWSAI